MNLFETNCVPPSQTVPLQNAKNTYFLTTNQPLAVQANAKNVEHASSAVSRRVFGPNDMIVMTTWMEKYTFSTVKSTTVGKPVVSDSVRIPSGLVSKTACQPNGNDYITRQPSSVSSIPCPVPGACTNPQCHNAPQPNVSDEQPVICPQTGNSSSQTSSSLVEVISQMEEEPEDQNEERTDSEDEEYSDSQDEESDSIEV